MPRTLTIDDIATGDTVRARSTLGADVVGVVTAVDAADRGGVIDLRTDGGADCWRRLDQIRMVIGADGVTKYAVGAGWR